MLQIVIPRGMEYVRKVKNNIPFDYLILRAEDGRISARIFVQDIAKEACQHRNRNTRYMAIDILGITCNVYFKKGHCSSPDTGKPVLYYWQEKNGKEPAKRVETGFFGENRIDNPADQTYHGSFWYQNLALSEAERAAIDAHQAEVRHNRRKDGNCPAPN